MSKHIGILGGTFDPIHLGHINLAKEVKKTLNLDEVWLEPNKIPYYKNTPQTLDHNRLEMIKLAIENQIDISVCDIELQQQNYLSTVEALTLLKNTYPNYSFTFIMGLDSFLNLDKWRRANDIISLANICVANRPQYSLNIEMLPQLQQNLYKTAIFINSVSDWVNIKNYDKTNRLYLLTTEEFNISSSTIRKLLNQKLYSQIENMLPDKVLSYIKKQKLYI